MIFVIVCFGILLTGIGLFLYMSIEFRLLFSLKSDRNNEAVYLHCSVFRKKLLKKKYVLHEDTAEKQAVENTLLQCKEFFSSKRLQQQIQGMGKTVQCKELCFTSEAGSLNPVTTTRMIASLWFIRHLIFSFIWKHFRVVNDVMVHTEIVPFFEQEHLALELDLHGKVRCKELISLYISLRHYLKDGKEQL